MVRENRLKHGFYRNSLRKDAPLTSWTLFPDLEKNGGKRVQLVRGASFQGDFLQNSYFKRVLRKIYYSPQSISLEVTVETKLFPDSALGNSLCNSWYKTKSVKKPLFSWSPMLLEIKLPPPGWSHGVLSKPKNLEKVQNYPPASTKSHSF